MNNIIRQRLYIFNYLLSALLFYYTCIFIVDIQLVQKIFSLMKIPRFFFFAGIVTISGIGLAVCHKILEDRKHEGWFCFILFLYCLVTVVIQFGINISPALARCHCISFLEAVESIKDWYQVKMAFILLIMGIMFIFFNFKIYKKYL